MHSGKYNIFVTEIACETSRMTSTTKTNDGMDAVCVAVDSGVCEAIAGGSHRKSHRYLLCSLKSIYQA